MRITLFKVVFCLTLLLVLSGCETAAKSANLKHIDDNTIDAPHHPRAELVLASKRLAGVVALTNVRFGTVVNFQRAEVGLQNTGGKALSLKYKVQWQDEQGFMVNQHTVWTPIKLASREIKNIQSLGKIPEAHQIQLTIRIAN